MTRVAVIIHRRFTQLHVDGVVYRRDEAPRYLWNSAVGHFEDAGGPASLRIVDIPEDLDHIVAEK